MDISPGAISNYENGNRTPKKEALLEKLLRRLEVNDSEINEILSKFKERKISDFENTDYLKNTSKKICIYEDESNHIEITKVNNRFSMITSTTEDEIIFSKEDIKKLMKIQKN